jgi:hypothetical protein
MFKSSKFVDECASVGSKQVAVTSSGTRKKSQRSRPKKWVIWMREKVHSEAYLYHAGTIAIKPYDEE